MAAPENAVSHKRKCHLCRPKLDPFTGIIDQTLESDARVARKRRHTSRRIFERLRNVHGFAGGIRIVKDYIFAGRRRSAEMFVPFGAFGTFLL